MKPILLGAIAAWLVGCLLVTAAAQERPSDAQNELLERAAFRQLQETWSRCGDRWAIGYTFRDGSGGLREIEASGDALLPEVMARPLTSIDRANGFDIKARVVIRGALMRDYDESGRIAPAHRGKWTDWQAAPVPVLVLEVSRRDGQWLLDQRFFAILQDVEGLGGRIYRPRCDTLPAETAAAGGADGPVQCQANATLYDLVGGQCLNGRSCMGRDPQTLRLVNHCVSRLLDPTSGRVDERAVPRCDCSRGVLMQ